MADTLYDQDFFEWTQAQAAALRRRGSGGNAIDYENLAEEVEDLGKRDLRECRSYVRLIIEHLLKLRSMPDHDSAGHWRAEVLTFRNQLRDALTPSLSRKVKAQAARLHEQSLAVAREEYGLALPSAEAAPFTWRELTDKGWFPARVDG